jgi:hypothetical protein
MYHNEADYFTVIQLSKKQRQCLGQMLYDINGRMRKAINFRLEYHGFGMPEGFTRKTYNSLIKKGAVIGDDKTGRVAYENAYVRGIAAQEAIKLANYAIDDLKWKIIGRAEVIADGAFLISAGDDWYDDLLGNLDIVGRDLLSNDNTLLALDNDLHKQRIIVDRLEALAEINIFCGLDCVEVYSDGDDIGKFPAEYMSRINMALRANWRFTTGWFGGDNSSACFSKHGDQITARVSMEDIASAPIKVKYTGWQSIVDALETAYVDADAAYEAWLEDW